MLASVGCNAHHLALNAYASLTAPGSLLPAALTLCLTLYVAALGLGLLTGAGGLRLSDVSRTGLKIGVVLALTLNWTAFQTLVFKVATEAPFEVARVFAQAGTDGTGADPLTRLEELHQELIDSADSLTLSGGARPARGTSAAAVNSPPSAQALYALATVLIVSTAGLIALAMVAQAVLVALGPAFMLFVLFDSTRGLFVGWVRALAAAVIAPITSWGGLMVALATLEPWIARLQAEHAARQITNETVSTLTTFIITFAAAQLAMALGAVVVSAAFNLPRPRRARETEPASSTQDRRQTAEARTAETRSEQLAQSLGMARGADPALEGRRIEIGGPTVRAAPAEALGSTAVARLGDVYRRPSLGAQLRAAPRPGAGGG